MLPAVLLPLLLPVLLPVLACAVACWSPMEDKNKV